MGELGGGSLEKESFGKVKHKNVRRILIMDVSSCFSCSWVFITRRNPQATSDAICIIQNDNSPIETLI